MSQYPESFRTESVPTDQRRLFYEQHRGIAVAMIVILFCAPFLGLLLHGLSGLVWSVLLSAAGYYLVPHIAVRLKI